MSLNELINPTVPLNINVANLTVNGTLDVSSRGTTLQSLEVKGNTTLDGTNEVKGNATLDGTLLCKGASTFNGDSTLSKFDPALIITNTGTSASTASILMKGSSSGGIGTCVIDAALSGDLNLICNTTNANITLQPNGTGAILLPNYPANSVPYIYSDNSIQAYQLTDGEFLIGQTSGEPVASTITGGNSISVVTSPGAISVGLGTGITAYTPALSFDFVTTGITYASRQGYYYTLGSMCFFNMFISLTSKGAAVGSARVTLPLTSSSVSLSRCIAPIPRYDNITTISQSLFLLMFDNSNVGELFQINNTDTEQAITNVEFTDGSLFNITGFYFI